MDNAEGSDNEEEMNPDNLVKVLQPKTQSFAFGTTLVFLRKLAVKVRKKFVSSFIFVICLQVCPNENESTVKDCYEL